MTPLAHKVARELTLPLKRRTFDDSAGVLRRFDDVHCFEVTEAVPLIVEMAQSMLDFGGGITSSFLPAAKVWIEWKSPAGRRLAVLLEQSSAGFSCTNVEEDGFRSWRGFDLSSDVKPLLATDTGLVLRRIQSTAHSYWIAAALALINSPRIVGRRQHMPHRGLERRLTQSLGLQGKFPLRAWTEILLRVAPALDASSDTPAEAHLTGAKALHFCRAHLRVRLGKLEVVRGHWRGDASLGIKRSRYRLAA